MARLAFFEIRNIKAKILKDLYGKKEEEFNLRKSKIAEQNRQLYLKPLQHIINQLPPELIAHNTRYVVKIAYTPTIDGDKSVHENWTYSANSAIPNPLDHGKASYYDPSLVNTLNPKLQPEAAQLCNEILVIRSEKADMEYYLDTTMKKYKGSLQLRKVLPEVFHKYLPAEKPKVTKTRVNTQISKKEKIPDMQAPEILGARLTNNLLEGN